MASGRGAFDGDVHRCDVGCRGRLVMGGGRYQRPSVNGADQLRLLGSSMRWAMIGRGGARGDVAGGSALRTCWSSPAGAELGGMAETYQRCGEVVEPPMDPRSCSRMLTHSMAPGDVE
jgi:hypothetical protein